MRKLYLCLSWAALGAGIFGAASPDYRTRLLAFTGILGGGLYAAYRLLKELIWQQPSGPPVMRGRRVLSSNESLLLHEAALAGERPRYFFGGMPFNAKAATHHFLIVGASGAGKTVTIKRLIENALSRFTQAEKALIYDAKTDLLSYLDHLGFPTPRSTSSERPRVALLHPFDARSLAWDIARDIPDLATAREIAHLLIPHEGDYQKHFPYTAASILSHAALSLMRKANESWTFRDLYLATRNRKRLEALLKLTPEGRDLVSLHFTNTEEFQSVLSTLSTHMTSYAPVAAAWWKAFQSGKTFSLSAWVEGKTAPVLVLGVDDTRSKAMEPINRVLFHRLTQLLLRPGQERTKGTRTWVFLDELPQAGKLDGLRKLMDKGRSFGVSTAIGFQSIESMTSAFGSEDEALAVTANCASKAFFRTESKKTAEFEAALLGPVEIIERSEGQSSSRSERGGTQSRSANFQLREKASVLSSEFFTLGPTDPAHGIGGIYVSQYAAWQHRDYNFPRVDPSARSPDFEPLASPPELDPWTEDDLKRLGLEELSGVEGVLEKNEKDDAGWVKGPDLR